MHEPCRTAPDNKCTNNTITINGCGATPLGPAHGGFAPQMIATPTTLIARQRVGGAAATLFLYTVQHLYNTLYGQPGFNIAYGNQPTPPLRMAALGGEGPPSGRASRGGAYPTPNCSTPLGVVPPGHGEGYTGSLPRFRITFAPPPPMSQPQREGDQGLILTLIKIRVEAITTACFDPTTPKPVCGGWVGHTNHLQQG